MKQKDPVAAFMAPQSTKTFSTGGGGNEMTEARRRPLMMLMTGRNVGLDLVYDAEARSV